MLENPISFFKLHKLFQILLCALFALFILFGAWFFLNYQSGKQESLSLLTKGKRGKISEETDNYSFKVALEERKEILLPLPPLQDEISFCKTEKRFDQETKDQPIVLANSRLEACFAKAGAPIYIDYDPIGKGLVLGKKETPFSLVPHYQSDGSLFATAYLALPSIQTTTPLFLEERGDIIDWKISEEFKKQVKPLSKAVGNPPDALFKVYGGKEYGEIGELYRLEMGKEVLFIKQGDHLIWDGHQWRKPTQGEDTRPYPVAEVMKIQDHKIDLMVFDVGGGQFLHIPISIAPMKGKMPNWSEILLRARKRTPHSISCRLAGKNMILQEGDWLMHRGKGWHVVQSEEELASLLCYEIKEELLVVDKIEEGQLTGHYFDVKRGQAQKISIPLIDGKKTLDSQKKKNRKSATIEGYDSNL